MRRVIMMKSTWHGNDYEDVYVTSIYDGESDKRAMERARAAYGENEEYYIKEMTP